VRPKAEWNEIPAEHLRIIDDDLWERVKTRRQAVSHSVTAIRASLHCRANSTGAGPKYLFSGLLTCGVCGSRFVICGATNYGCSTWRTRSTSVCSNSLTVRRTLVETLLTKSIQRDLFTTEGLEVFTAEVHRLLAEVRRQPDKTRGHLAAVEQEIQNIMSAIRAGILTPTTKAALESAEAERTRLQHQQQDHSKLLSKTATFLPNLEAEFKRLVDGLPSVTQHHVDKARGIIKTLVGGSIRLHPTTDETGRYLTAELSGDYAGLVRLAVGPKLKVVAVTRIERVTRGL
jgi:site-specific DNA recombinase